MAWNSVETRNTIQHDFKKKTIFFQVYMWGFIHLLTICSNSPITVVVGKGQKAPGLFVRQDTSARTKPLEEKSVGTD